MQNSHKPRPLFPMIVTALLAAIATVLYFLGFPIFPAAPFLQLDFSDIPALLAAMVFGPVYGVAVNLIQNFIGLIAGSFAAHAGIGNLMNFAVGVAFVVPYAIIVRRAQKKHGRIGHKDVVIAGAVSMISIIVVGFGMNTIVLPLFFRFVMGMPMEEIWTMVWSTIVFSTVLNAIKGAVLTTAGTIFVYLPLRNMLERKFLQNHR